MHIAPLRPEDRARWEVLARGYKAFYETPTSDAQYELTWERLLAHDGIAGLGATLDGRLVGIAHYLFHTTIWAPKTCYLQDLYTDADVRGRGVARALIEALAREAREQGAQRLYWHTRSSNTVARALYDKVAAHTGFIRYERPLDAA